MGYKKQQWELGPNPDISKYEDICTKYGWFRRKIRKRGSKLNYVMGSFRSATKVSSPAAKRLIEKLSPWTDVFAFGWVKATVSGRLAKSYVESGRMTFANMKDVDINQVYPL